MVNCAKSVPHTLVVAGGRTQGGATTAGGAGMTSGKKPVSATIVAGVLGEWVFMKRAYRKSQVYVQVRAGYGGRLVHLNLGH